MEFRKTALALIRVALALLGAVLLSELAFVSLVLPGIMLFGDPEGPLLRPTVETPLESVRGDAPAPEVLVEIAEDADLAEEVTLRETDGEPLLVLVGLRVPGSAAAFLKEHGYSAEAITIKPNDMPAILGRIHTSEKLLAFQLVVQMICFGGVAGLLLRSTLDSRDRPPAPWPTGRAVAVGFLGGFAGIASAVVIGVMQALAGIPVQEQPWVGDVLGAGAMTVAIFVVLIVVAGPIVEELFFRSWVFRFLSREAGPGIGYTVSALLFAGIHFNPTGVAIYLVYGFLLAALYRRTGRLLTPIVAHATINGFAVGVALVVQAASAS